MKTFEVTVDVVVRLTLDETKFDAAFMEEFSSTIFPADDLPAHAEHLGWLFATGRAHGLRKAGATIAAENGASDRQLMAMFGWATARQAGVYTRKASSKTLAREAALRVRIE